MDLNCPIQTSLSRRRVLIGGSTVLGTASLGGCTEIFEFFEDFVLDDVIVFNETGDARSGEIMIENADGEAIIDDPLVFDFDGVEDEDEDESGEIFEDVWEEDGEYTITVTLDEGSELNDTSEVEKEIELTDIEEEHLAILLFDQDTVEGEEEVDSVVETLVIESLVDIGDEFGDIVEREDN